MGFNKKRSGWFPGHMKSAKEVLKSSAHLVDLIINLVDSRAPIASSNFSILKLFSGKPVVFFLGKSDLADETTTKGWVSYFKNNLGVFAKSLNCRDQNSVKNSFDSVCDWLQGIKKLKFGKNMVRAMVVGISNVGKSSLINSIVGSKKAKVENRPGVTRSNQWIFLSNGVGLLDTPGVLQTVVDDEQQMDWLQLIGAIKREVVDVENLAINFLSNLKKFAGFNEILLKKFFIDFTETEFMKTTETTNGLNLLLNIAKFKKMVLKGNELDTERAANFVVDSFQKGKFGRLSLEMPKN